MTKKIRGAFPGGPSREAGGASASRRPRLETVEELERANAARALHRARRKRRRRLALAFGVSLLVAGGTGVYLGYASHQTIDDVRAERPSEEPRALTDAEISAEVNRALLELWKMEDVEYLRNAR